MSGYWGENENNLIRMCRCCRKEDSAKNLFSIKRITKNGKVQGWWFHEKCMLEKGYTKESLGLLLNDVRLEANEITKRLSINNTQSNSSLSVYSKVKYMNEKNLNSVKGSEIESNSPIKIINKTYQEVNLSEGRISGVYGIKNLINNRVYIGSSTNIKQRLQHHYGLLFNKNHKNYKIQGDYDNYKNENFEFWILEIADNEYKCNDTWLHITEQKYIDISNAFVDGYNIHPIAGFYGSKEDYDGLINDGN